MNEQNIRSDADLRSALVLEACMAEARRYAAEQKFAGKDKKAFMRAARKQFETQAGSNDSKV